jgi:hypothetical protein
MINYKLIDKNWLEWINKKNYTVQTKYRDDNIRSFFVWSMDKERKVQIAITYLDDHYVELGIFLDNKHKVKIKDHCANIKLLLDKAEQLATDWLIE